MAAVAGERCFNPNTNPTVVEVIDHWREIKRRTIKRQALKGYEPHLKIIVYPILQGTLQERVHHALTGGSRRAIQRLRSTTGRRGESNLAIALWRIHYQVYLGIAS